jgi:hypothetical protein
MWVVYHVFPMKRDLDSLQTIDLVNSSDSKFYDWGDLSLV